MSIPYCYDCLEREPCNCDRPSERTIFGELNVAYLKGYRDAKEGKKDVE